MTQTQKNNKYEDKKKLNFGQHYKGLAKGFFQYSILAK